MLNIALPLSAHPINFWGKAAEENNYMATTQQFVRQALEATRPRLRTNARTPEKLIVSQKLPDFSDSSSAVECLPFTHAPLTNSPHTHLLLHRRHQERRMQ